MQKALLQKFILSDFKKSFFHLGGSPPNEITFYLQDKPDISKSIVLKYNQKIILKDGKFLFQKTDISQPTLNFEMDQSDELKKAKVETIKFDDFGFLIVSHKAEADKDSIIELIQKNFKAAKYNLDSIIQIEGFKKVFLFMNQLPDNLKSQIAGDFTIKQSDVQISEYKDKKLVTFLTNLTEKDGLITKITNYYIEDEFKEEYLKLDIASGNTMTEMSSKLDNITSVFENLDFDKLEQYIDKTKSTLGDLRDIRPEDIEKIEQVQNLFQNFTARLAETAENLKIKTNKHPVIVVPPPLPQTEDKTSSLLSIFAKLVDKINEFSDFQPGEETTIILKELEEQKKLIDKQINLINEKIKEFNLATEKLQSKDSISKYFNEQKGKERNIHIAGRNYNHNEANQDMVFYNGSGENVLEESIQPMISLPNLVSGQNDNKSEIKDETIKAFAEKGFAAAEIDTSNLEKYLSKNIQTGGSLYKINYNGGNLEVEVADTNKIIEETSKLKVKTVNFKKKIMEYQSALGEFKLAYVQSFYYSLFLIISINNSILTSSQLVYELLSAGNCQYYLNIINVILDKINTGSIGPAEKFFQKYHFLLLNDMKLLLIFILDQTKLNLGDIENGVFNGVQSNIIVSKCRGKIASLLSIFNSFKDILDAYKSQVLPPVSVYVRINDWKQNNEQRQENGKPKGVQHGSNNLEISERDPKHIIFTRNDDDGRILDVSLDKCKDLHYNQEKSAIDKASEKYNNVYNKVEKIKVEEVLSSQDIPTNEALNKYMSLSNQLQKKDIMLITYGTSGIGKSFALFGGRGQKGLLQSTLSEIRGKPKIFFRVFELYLMGVQYPFYWENKEKIYQRCFTYEFDVSGDLSVKSVDMISDSIGISEFISKTKTPEDEGSKFHEMEFHHYNNFVDIVEQIDNVRSKENKEIEQPEHYPQRIKKTTNNPQSSRSVIIYEFLIQFSEENNKRLVIVDLPGLEDPKISYVENPKFNINDDGSSKILGASFLMNPIFIPLFKQEYSIAIREFIMKQDKEIKDGWLNTQMITLSSNTNGSVIRKEPVSLYINSKSFDLTDKGKGFHGDNMYKGPKFDDKKNNNTGDLQRFNNCFVYFILYLINEGKIDVLVDLIVNIIKNGGVRGDITDWESSGGNEIDYTSLNEKIKLAYEGIAINENILGLIYFLISKVETTEGSEKKYKNPSNSIESQEDISKGLVDGKDRREDYGRKTIAIGNQYVDGNKVLKETAGEIFAREARTIIKKAYSDDNNPDLNNIKIKNIDGDIIATTQTLYEDSVNSYDHKKIFTVPPNLGDPKWLTAVEVQDRIKEKQVPLIFDYLSPYLGDGPVSSQWAKIKENGKDIYLKKSTGEKVSEKPADFKEESKGIESVVLFTLLTNNDPKKKCLIQINLLKDSLSFMEELVV